MKLHSQESLLDIRVRKQIIQEIRETGNQKRKDEARKRHEVYKDNAVKFVLKKLENEGLRPKTLQLMQNRASNISICKKVINKLARAYQHGVTRSTGEDLTDKQIELAAFHLDFDEQMKKADRFLQLQRNAMPWFCPEEVEDGKFVIKMKVLGPWQYDAVENARDVDCPIAIVLSDYYSPSLESSIKGGRNQVTYTDSEGTKWKENSKIAQGAQLSRGEDVTEYIFWSNKYHFTTDSKGNIIKTLSPEDLANPIGEIPGLPLAKGRDDTFWADGGQDLVDGSVLVNTLITDLNAIMFMQGWGQLVITGPKGSIPKEMEAGPHHAMVLTHNAKKGEGEAKVTVVSSNPPVEGWLRIVEQYVALMLTTNNLSPRAVSGKLDSTNMASGLAMMIDSADSSEDVKDSQGDMARAERWEWKIYAKYHNLYYERGLLDSEFKAIGKLPDAEKLNVALKFTPGREVISESERIANMKARKELGLVSLIDLIMQDNPGMSEEQAEKKALEIRKAQVETIVDDATGEIKDKVEGEDGTTDTKAPTPNEGSPAPGAGGATGVDKFALNGAQVTALVEIVAQVARGEIPRESGIEMIQAAFPFIDDTWAEQIMSSAGKGFKPAAAPPQVPQGTPRPPFKGKGK